MELMLNFVITSTALLFWALVKFFKGADTLKGYVWGYEWLRIIKSGDLTMVVSYLLSQCNRGVWLVAVIKSQPEKNSSSVKVADDKSFRQVVADSGREAFILFYSPHCKHCNRLAPVWEELGEKLRGEAIDIVKIDGTTNKLLTSEYGVTRYPTIFWKFANMAKRPVKYDGGRDLQDFIKYVCEHASQELRGWDRKGMPK